MSRRPRLRHLLIASGVAVAVVAAGTWALLSSGDTGQAAQTAVQPPTAQSDPVREPQRASRDNNRTAPPVTKPKPRPKPKLKPKKKAPSYKVIGSGACEASYYWDPQPTASGERFDPSELTAAHKTLPMHSKVRVTNRNNGKSVTVRINDRGPYVGGRCLDLSKAAMSSVGGTGSGVIPVKYQVLAKR